MPQRVNHTRAHRTSPTPHFQTPPQDMEVFSPDRVSRLAKISTKFHAHAAVGDRVVLGIKGDDQMPARYRNAATRPSGTIVKIKNEGTERATLRVQLDTGRNVDLLPYQLDGGRVWEFAESSWPKVLARSRGTDAASSSYRGSSPGDDLSQMRQQMNDMTQRFDRQMAEQQTFSNALVESIAQITGEMQQSNPGKGGFSKVFQEEYRGMNKRVKEEGPVFDSDIGSDDEY